MRTLRAQWAMLCLTSGVVATWLPGAALAAEGPNEPASSENSESTSSENSLGEIVVTARRREESLEKVPVAVTAFDGDQLREKNVTQTQDLVFSTPSLSVQTNLQGRNSANFFIRGQGVSTGGVLPSVVSYFAEVPLDLNGGAAFALNDVQSVQVLRGPQGTLFGRNANGGAVLLTPVAPGQEVEGFFDASYGNYNWVQAKGAVTLPLGSTLSVRISGAYSDHTGFTRNLDGADMDNLFSESARVFVRWTPIDGFRDDLIYNFQHVTSRGTAGILDAVRPGSAGAAFYPLPGLPLVRGTGLANDLITQNQLGPHTISDPSDYWGEISTIHLATNTASWTLGSATIKNITGFEDVNVCSSDPVASTETNFYVSTCIPNNMYAAGQGVTQYPNIDLRQITNETNLGGDAFDNKLTYIGGVFLLWDNPVGGQGTFRDTRMAKSLFVANITTSVEQDRSQAAYTQATYAVTDKLKVTGGVRYTWDQRSLQFGQIVSEANGFPGTFGCATPGLAATAPTSSCLNIYHHDYTGLGYTFDVDYQLTPDTLVYLTTRRGYKSGGFNSTSTSTNPEYNSEVLRDVEVGEKFQWRGDVVRGSLNTDVFYSWYDGIQQQLTAVVDNQATVLVTNAGNAKIYGLEAEAQATFFDRLTLSAYYSYLHGKYDSCPANPTPADCFLDSGKDVTRSALLGMAKNTGSVSARYDIPLGKAGDVAAQATYYIRSATPYAADNVLNYEGVAPGYSITNARLEWNNIAGSNMDVYFYGSNIFNRDYVTSGYGLGGLIGTDTRVYGDPRTWGGGIHYRF